MKKIDKAVLLVMEKLSRELIDSEKEGRLPCPLVFHQPQRPDKVKGEKWK